MPGGITTTLLLAALVCAILALSIPGAATAAFILIGMGIVSEVVLFLLNGLVGEDRGGPEDGLGS